MLNAYIYIYINYEYLIKQVLENRIFQKKSKRISYIFINYLTFNVLLVSFEFKISLHTYIYYKIVCSVYSVW